MTASALAAGLDDYLTKPIRRDQLVESGALCRKAGPEGGRAEDAGPGADEAALISRGDRQLWRVLESTADAQDSPRIGTPWRRGRRR